MDPMIFLIHRLMSKESDKEGVSRTTTQNKVVSKYEGSKYEGSKYEGSKYDNLEFWLTVGIFV